MDPTEDVFMRISVIGLGKLGAPAAAVFAAKGHDVIGLDVNITLVNALRAGKATVEEPRLQEMIDAGQPRLTATADYNDLVKASDLTFVIV
ncbi:MAG: 3-hydroxyacyl-CoA dehydrogenase NAD-binding domain-containing protein, partial [Vulcanimicrobiaceae bacterium]